MNQWFLLVSLVGQDLYHLADTKPWHFDTQIQCEEKARTLSPIFKYKCERGFFENNGMYPSR